MITTLARVLVLYAVLRAVWEDGYEAGHRAGHRHSDTVYRHQLDWLFPLSRTQRQRDRQHIRTGL